MWSFTLKVLVVYTDGTEIKKKTASREYTIKRKVPDGDSTYSRYILPNEATTETASDDYYTLTKGHGYFSGGVVTTNIYGSTHTYTYKCLEDCYVTYSSSFKGSNGKITVTSTDSDGKTVAITKDEKIPLTAGTTIKIKGEVLKFTTSYTFIEAYRYSLDVE